MTRIFLDADACPVKAETYRLAERRGLKVFVVSSGSLHVSAPGRVERVRVKPGLDAADDWIVEHAGPGDVVVTADIRLAQRCLERGARPIAHDGGAFHEGSIGDALAGRDLLDELRQMGVETSGPRPFTRSDRARYVAGLARTLDELERDRG